MLELLRSLVFPHECVGCGRGDVLLCPACADSAGASRTIVHAGLTTFSAVTYRGAVRDAINAFKRGRRALGADLARILEPYVDERTVLVPIPTTRRRVAERGFDQTLLLARILRRRCGVRVASLLVRGPGAPQHGRSQRERLRASGRFRARRAASEGDLVLFDDVRTTGATLLDAARTLEVAGFRIAGALTLAWTPEEGP